jgi:hypothetical protein
MKRLVMIGSAIAALALGSVAAYAATATVTTASPWAYACGHTTSGNPATATDAGATCAHGTTDNVGYCKDAQGQPVADTPGAVAAAFASGKLTLTKEGPTCDDMASGATIKGLTTLTAASFDLVGESYCAAGAPRLNVVTSDNDTHFFGCLANKSGNHVIFKLDAAGDGSGKGGIVGKTVKSIDIVQDETGTAVLTNLAFTGTAVVTATPTPTATPATSHLATTGGGGGDVPLWPIGLVLSGLGLAVLGLGGLAIRRRIA